MPTTDREFGQKSERLGRQLEGREHRAGVNNLGEHRGTVAAGIKFQVDPLGGKNPFDKWDSERRVLAM